MTFGAPQIILIVLVAMSFTIHMLKHGTPREGTYNVFFYALVVAIEFGLLYWGGFFGN